MSEIETSHTGGILTIAFNRPAKKNALTLSMYTAIAAALEAAEADDDTRVVVLSGRGGDFTAGNDLHDFLANPPLTDDSPVFRFLRAISSASRPLVAAVTGVAVGVGATMLLHCDLVYLGAGATLSLPFVNLALVPEAACSLLLPALIGYHHAAELLLLGEPFGAETAKAYGIANAVFPDADVLSEAMQVAARLAAKPPVALRLTKQLMRRGRDVAGQMAAEGTHFRAQLQSAEAREAMSAILARRLPKPG
jgi:enoyl-CoA hydratase/carnithine racemase